MIELARGAASPYARLPRLLGLSFRYGFCRLPSALPINRGATEYFSSPSRGTLGRLMGGGSNTHPLWHSRRTRGTSLTTAPWLPSALTLFGAPGVTWVLPDLSLHFVFPYPQGAHMGHIWRALKGINGPPLSHSRRIHITVLTSTRAIGRDFFSFFYIPSALVRSSPLAKRHLWHSRCTVHSRRLADERLPPLSSFAGAHERAAEGGVAVQRVRRARLRPDASGA